MIKLKLRDRNVHAILCANSIAANFLFALARQISTKLHNICVYVKAFDFAQSGGECYINKWRSLCSICYRCREKNTHTLNFIMYRES